MSKPNFGLVLAVQLSARNIADGGRRGGLVDQMRPLVRFDGDDRAFGLCEVRLTRQIPPGQSDAGSIAFDQAHTDAVGELARPGIAIVLLEGAQVVAAGRVEGVKRPEELDQLS